MDGGEVLQGLDEPWTFLRANMMEWTSGMLVFLMIGSVGRTPAAQMPLMLVGWVVTTSTLSVIRNMFPDQERGVRNALMASCGFAPPGIPTPARLQHVWSGAPIRQLPALKKFNRIGFDQLFPSFQRQLTEIENNEE